jgi:outer membrane protein OmpU
MNIKKIGMTALAASLVSTSVFAGELTATGTASITVENYSSTTVDAGKAFSMNDSVILGGSTELDNGMTVAMSFELDNDNDAGSYDNRSVTISSDAMGTFVFSAHGGSSAVSAMDATAAGDIFDTFDAQVLTGLDSTAEIAETNALAGNAAMLTSPGGNNSIFYTLPTMIDSLAVTASYNPQGSAAASSQAYAATYTGVEGLSVSYGAGSDDSGIATTNADVQSMKISYALGSFTVAYSDHEYDSVTATRDQETTSFSLAYTVSDAISVTYGEETMDSGEGAIDAEYSKISASYTAGGMTITAVNSEAQNISYTAAVAEDQDYWGLTLGFAF